MRTLKWKRIMALIPWKSKRNGQNGDELSPLMESRGEVDWLFDAFIRNPWGSLSEGFSGQRSWLPAIDVAETNQDVTVRAEIPGVDPKDLEISVFGNLLTLAGKKKDLTEKQPKGCYHRESHYGAFRRKIEVKSV